MAKEAKSKEKKAKASKEKKSTFLKDTKAELKKVIWPSPKQLFNNTVAVIVIVLIVGIIVFLLDFCFTKINEFGVDKLKSTVQSVQVNEEDAVSDSSEVELTAESETESTEDTKVEQENDSSTTEDAE